MDFETLIASRQSCRNFDSARIPAREEIVACLEAARLAPSACNGQPLHFTVCTGETAQEVAPCLQSMGMNKFASDAPCFLVVSEESYNATAAVGARFKDQDYRSVDIGLAVSYLTLAATERGLASCILGWFDEKKLQKLLSTARRIRLVVALGYAAAEDPLRPKIRKDFAALVDFR